MARQAWATWGRALSAATCVLALAACGSSDEGPSGAPQPPVYDVYLTGYLDGAPPSYMDTMPFSWKNGSLVSLDVSGGKAGVAGKLYVSGGDVYVSGAVHGLGGMTYHPCYWRNQQRIDLSEIDPTPERASTLHFAHDIVVVGTDLYVSGDTPDASGRAVACYWRNGVRTDLTGLSSRGSRGVGLQVLNGEVYVSGTVFSATGARIPCYWRNGALTLLSVPASAQHGVAQFIQVAAGGSVSVSGDVWTDATRTMPGYWLNGTRTELPVQAGGSGHAFGLVLAGTDVYVAGNLVSPSRLESACYWKNGERVDLPPMVAGKQSIASDIVVADGSVYVAGAVSDGTSGTYPCYWKDGALTSLAVPGVANAIRVVAR